MQHVALSETLHREIIGYRKQLVVPRFPLYVPTTVIQRERGPESETGKRKQWRMDEWRSRNRKGGGSGKKQKEGNAVVLVSSQVKDLINMEV